MAAIQMKRAQRMNVGVRNMFPPVRAFKGVLEL